MAIPKRYKHSCVHRLSYEGTAKGCKTVDFGTYGLRAEEGSYITERQIEAARVAMTRYMKRGGKVWIRIFPQLPITRKPAEVRMGSGKGSIDHWVAVVKAKTVMFEVSYPNEATAREALRLAMHKLPIKCKIITREIKSTEEVKVAKNLTTELGEANGNASN